jgi:hypothetical protein
LARVRFASQIELFAVGTGVALLVFSVFIQGNGPFSFLIIRTAGDPMVLAAAGFLFFEIFAFLLSGNAVIVGVLVKGGWLQLLTARNVKALKSSNESGLERPYFGNIDDVQRAFGPFLERSKEAARTAQHRPNALLFVGTIVAAVGLLFFLVTLPGFITLAGDRLDSFDLWKRLLDLIPGLLMLLFIQLLAGFFLRQYRSSMEEYRYYESILRFREAQFLSYIVRRSAADKAAIDQFAKEILEERNFIRVAKDETTLVMEAQKQETNEFKDLMTSIFEFMKTNRVVNPEREVKKTVDGHGDSPPSGG